MALTYARKAEITKRFDRISDCWEFTKTATYRFRRDGEIIGSAVVQTTWKEGVSGGFRPRKWVGYKFRHDWQVELFGRAWTSPGVRCKDEVLAEIKRLCEARS